MSGDVRTVTYAHGISVTYERMPDCYGPDQRWYYAVWYDDGAECEESGYGATRAECADYARTCRDGLAYRVGL